MHIDYIISSCNVDVFYDVYVIYNKKKLISTILKVPKSTMPIGANLFHRLGNLTLLSLLHYFIIFYMHINISQCSIYLK